MRLRFDFKSDLLPSGPLIFSEPLRVVTAHSVSEVIPALQAVQQAAETGLWAAGYVAYEAAPAFDSAMQTHPAPEMPLVWFGIYEKEKRVEGEGQRAGTSIHWRPGIERAEYNHAVEEIREAIGRGEFYQANYTFPLHGTIRDDAYALYVDLAQSSKCGYGAFLDLGEWCILSASLELFFQFDHLTHNITTRPMKGTRSRGRWLSEDLREADDLGRSDKDRAENLMIVDLLRNDLGRIAVPGTVSTPALFSVEQYPTVWQMTSTITAQVSSDVTVVDIFKALFPCGSVTGAPKIAAMQKLTEMERVPRGIYCGAIGLIKPGGSAIFNVAIRTMTIHMPSGAAAYHVGGGITWDSTTDSEYEEALTKARIVTENEPDFDLFETLRLENGEFSLRFRHIERILESASYFGRALTKASIDAELDRCAAEHPAEVWRVRLVADREGTLSTEAILLKPVVGAQPFELAKEQISSRNRFLFHKTTNRIVHETAYNHCGPVFDVLLFNERGELTEFTRGNLVVDVDGNLFTPPRKCGLLAGTFRAEMLDQGKLTERVLTLDILSRAMRIWFINSVHGWIEMRQVREGVRELGS